LINRPASLWLAGLFSFSWNGMHLTESPPQGIHKLRRLLALREARRGCETKGVVGVQKTLILVKPDGVQRRLVGTILRRFEQKGLRLAGLKLVQASRDLAEKHYAVHKGKPFYESLLQFLTAGPTVAMVLEGREAVTVARTLMGPTDGAKAAPATIRGDFAISVQNNLVHGSDSPENAASEIALWFKPDELVSFQPVDAAWVSGN
jgi:nucleoside-diphosphate kinase